MQFLHILNSNFQPENARRRTSDLVQMKALNLSFHLVPLAFWRTTENRRYKPSKFANFVWGLYGIASISRKKKCCNFFPIQNAFDHVTVLYKALCRLDSFFLFLSLIVSKRPFTMHRSTLGLSLHIDSIWWIQTFRISFSKWLTVILVITYNSNLSFYWNGNLNNNL